MLYSLLKVLRNQVPGSTEYKIPIIAHQDLYNRIENIDDVTKVLLLEGRTEGYDSIVYFYQDVCRVLGFNPFMLKKKFLINTRGINTQIEPDLINAFGGEYEEWNGQQANFYPMEEIGANILGYTHMSQGYSGAQATLAQTVYGAGGDYVYPFINVIREKQHDTFAGVEYVFEIWPETAIEHGYIDTQHFYRDNDLIKSAHIYFDVWYDAENNKYFFNVYLGAGYYSDVYTDYVDNKLNQAELDRVYNPENPFDNNQGDGDQGGNEESDDDSDPVDVPDLPTLDISDLGGFNLFKVSAADVKALFTYLNSHDPGEAILKWIQNPIQGIISLHVLPYPVTVPGGSGNSITILGIDTGVAGYKVAPYQEWELGGVRVPYGFDNTFLDYEPYTKVAIYLPFIGIKELDADEVIGQSVTVTYQFDNVSGACIAFVSINGAVRYSFTGSCAMSLPINQQNWGQAYMAAATIAAGALAGGVGAAGAALAQGAGGAEIAASGLMGAVQGSGGFGAIQKPTISRSGCISGAAAALGVPHPYIIIERPTKASAANPAPVSGLISGRTLPLSSLSGYNIIEHVHLHGISATGPELEEIEKLLYQGVIF